MNHSPQADYRVIVGLCALTAAAVTPFFVYHALHGVRFMAVITGGLVAFTASAAVWLYRRRSRTRLIRRTGTVIVLVANVTVCLAVADQREATIFWIYPLIFINFYLLASWLAAALNVAVCGLSVWLVAGIVPDEQLARLAGSIPLCIFFGLVFSQSIQRQRRELHYLANHDALTGVGNRLGLNAGLEDAAQRRNRYGETSSLILLDIDHFKAINDHLGHLKGDGIIAEFARILAERLRRTDRLYRFGGEEFVILLPHTGLAEAFHLAETLRESVAHQAFTHGQRLTASGGVSELVPGETADAWLDRADQALYDAKSAGRNRVFRARPPEL